MRRHGLRSGLLALAASGLAAGPLNAQQLTLFTENFETLVSQLGPVVDEAQPNLGVWTDTPPAGWTVDDTGVPGYDNPDNDGVTEWAGWSFAKVGWWAQVAGDQNRTQFTKGIGNVAIADPDEWDDAGHPSTQSAYFNAVMASGPIAVTGIPAGALTLTFDSSWRPEGFDDGDGTNNQTAIITASYDGGAPVEVLHWDSDNGGIVPGDYFHPDATNETVTVSLSNPAGANNLVLTFSLLQARNDWWWAVDNVAVKNGAATVYSQNFDGVTLEPAVDEQGPSPNVWTATPPENWFVDRSGVPAVGDPNIGVAEFEGWTFVNAEWWAQTAGDQQRSAFVAGRGIVAVADPDEWDDKGNPESLGTFNSYLQLPPIQLGPVGLNTVVMTFRSSWRDEDTQTAVILVSYDGAPDVEVLRWTSTAGPNFKNDATNEIVSVPLNNPIGATSAVIRFGLIDATDDWWWAIDDIEIEGELASDTIKLLVEDFNGVPLGPCVEENCQSGPVNVWSATPPAGWTVDKTGVPGVGDPEQGMEEWEGWTFANKDWWAFVAEGQDRELFTKGVGVVAIADPDEWDDRGNPDQSGAATFNSFLTTPAIPLGGTAANTATLAFDSSWRDEDNQTAVVTVSYDGGAAIEVLRWESQAGPNFHDDNVDESVSVPLNNPPGATSMVLSFRLTNAINNWWWAIDNVVVSDGTSTLFSQNFESVTLGPPVQESPFPPSNVWTDQLPAGWMLDDTHVAGFDQGLPGTLEDQDGRTEWAGWSIADPQWWSTVAGDQDRSLFTKGTGGVAIADADEWDDQPHPAFNPGDENLFRFGYNAFMSTPTITITGVQPRDLYIAFDSTWKSWDPPFNIGRMTAVIDVSYDGAEPERVMRWANYPGWPPEAPNPPGDPDYKEDALNESVLVPLANPRADTATITFGLIDAGNDWWWAIDNVVVFALKPGSDPAYDYDGDGDVDMADYGVFQVCYDPPNLLNAASPAECLRSDYEPNLRVNELDLERFIDCFSGPAIPADPACDD